MRVAIFAHAHPELQAGGAERAAYTLFQQLKARDDVTPVFVARAKPEEVAHDGVFGAFRGRADEIIWSPPEMDFVRLTSGDAFWFDRQFNELCDYLVPDLIHVQHYFFYGVDIFPLAAKRGIPVVLTLHEYMPICLNAGQMVKTSGGLCHQSSAAECAACFPDITAGKFFLRKTYLQNCLSHVSHFVSPSDFLIDRYVAWGLPLDKFSMIENLVTASAPESMASRPPASTLQLGFFGQINRFKGLEVLLRALALLPEEKRHRVKLTIFGANLEMQEKKHRKTIKKLIKSLKETVVFAGSYRNEDVIQLMQSVDWVVIPSIWWENSPLVIQEAAIAGTPVLASNIGGMKEKVIDGKTGAHFLVGSPVDLAEKIGTILAGDLKIEPRPLDIVPENVTRAESHLEVYRKALS